MNVEKQARAVAARRGWTISDAPDGGLSIQVVTERGRSQEVTLVAGTDWDGDAIATLASRAAHTDSVRDLFELIDHAMLPPYGGARIIEGELAVTHTLLDKAATEEAVAKAIEAVANAADDIERKVHGEDADVF